MIPMYKTFELYTRSTKPENLVVRAIVPKMADGLEPDVLIWGSRFFKRSGETDKKGDWRYIECRAHSILRTEPTDG